MSAAIKHAQATPPAAGALSGRRADLDWIRVVAFGLLILFHVGLVYAPYDWHVKSAHTFDWMAEAILVTGPWRLTLLFLVSGAALRFVWSKKTAGELAASRMARLAPPLVFGVVALVPVQSWIEAMDKGSWSGSLLGWMVHEFSPSGLADAVPVNHLWFLVYVVIYTLVVVALFADRRVAGAVEDRLAQALSGWRLLVWPVAYLFVIRVTLFPHFGLNNGVVADWYNHALSLGAFLLGFLIVGREAVWRDLERFRTLALATAAVTLLILALQTAHPGGGALWGVPRAAVFATYQWAAIAAALGYGSRHLRGAKGPVLAYLNQAVFPCYLAHQTILVMAAWLIRPAQLPPAVEALLLVSVTVGGSLLTYEAVRRLPWVRPFWGLRTLAAPGRRGNHRGLAHARLLLGVGVAAPVAALVAVCLALAAQPDLDHGRQYISELGGASAKAAEIFNAGVLAAGVMAAAAGVGFGLAIAALGRSRVFAALCAACFMLAGAGLVTAALYPWPDPRHLAINLGLGIQAAPLLLLAGLWRRRDLPRLKLFLGSVFVVMAVLTVITKHLVFPGTVNESNVGWWERGYALILVGWVGVAALILERRLEDEASQAPAA